MYLDLMREIFEKKLGMTIVPHQLPWKRCQAKVRIGEADIMLTVATDERLEYALKSDQSFYELYLNVCLCRASKDPPDSSHSNSRRYENKADYRRPSFLIDDSDRDPLRGNEKGGCP